MSQQLSEVIWQARNQALHCEEQSFRTAVDDCFTKLATGLPLIVPGGLTPRPRAERADGAAYGDGAVGSGDPCRVDMIVKILGKTTSLTMCS